MAASAYHSRGRHWILAGSAIRALESFVRSIIKYGSREMIVIWPGYFSSRRAWIRPRVPLPLFCVSMLLSISCEGIWVWIDRDYLPSNDNDLLLRLCDAALYHGVALSRFDIFLSSTNVDCALFFKDLEYVQSIGCWGIFDVTSRDIETGCTEYIGLVIYISFRSLPSPFCLL